MVWLKGAIMSIDPKLKRRATDKPSSSGQSDTPRERRSRKRRTPSEFRQEIEPLLTHVEPEVRLEIQGLMRTGKMDAARKQLLNYATKADHTEFVQDIIRKTTVPVEKRMDWYVYALSVIPVLIVLYCIFSLLSRGHIQVPW